MQRSSLHNHTVFCDGKSTPWQMLESAFKEGITDLGFSRHSDYAFFCGDRPSEDEYIKAIEELKKANPYPVKVYLGVEEDLFAPVDKGKYEYTIGSTHHFEKEGKRYPIDHTAEDLERALEEFFGGNALSLAEQYYSQVLACAKKKPTVLGHFDLIRKCGGKIVDFNSPKYLSLALDCASACVSEGVVFEVNYGAIPRKKLNSPYPSDEILSYIIGKGGKVTLSTDCHDANQIAFGLCEGEEKLRLLGAKELYEFRGGSFEAKKL